MHCATTGPEIWEDTEGRIDIFVAGVGTGGTVTGTGEYLKSRHPGIRVVAVEPASSPVLSGGSAGPHKIQGLAPALSRPSSIPGYTTRCSPSGTRTPFHRPPHRTLRGRSGGHFSGAAAFAALELARQPENAGKTIVVSFPPRIRANGTCPPRYSPSRLWKGGGLWHASTPTTPPPPK